MSLWRDPDDVSHCRILSPYLGYTLRMRTLFRGWPIMVNDTHTRRLADKLHQLIPNGYRVTVWVGVTIRVRVGVSVRVRVMVRALIKCVFSRRTAHVVKYEHWPNVPYIIRQCVPNRPQLAEMVKTSRHYDLHMEHKCQLGVNVNNVNTEAHDTGWQSNVIPLQNNLTAHNFLQLLTSPDPHYLSLVCI